MVKTTVCLSFLSHGLSELRYIINSSVTLVISEIFTNSKLNVNLKLAAIIFFQQSTENVFASGNTGFEINDMLVEPKSVDNLRIRHIRFYSFIKTDFHCT
jgi:hypothetical protein